MKEKYDKLDALLIKKGEDEEINRLFREILDDTFKLINKKIENNETLNIKNLDEKLATRAMFEYMIELWEEGSIDEAKEVGYDMLYLVDDKKLKEMFSMFVIGMLEGLSVDEFFKKYVKDSTYEDYFFCDFNDEIDELIIKHQERFKKEFSKDA